VSDSGPRPPRPPRPPAPHPPGSPDSGPHPPGRLQQGIAAAVTEVTERASVLIREEIELAKTEIGEKATRLAKGAVVAGVAGIFFLTALFFVLVGCAWLLYYELPIGNAYTYFWGFFAMAVILVVLGALAGFLAARAVKAGAPPTPQMAIEEARKIRETVSSSGAPVKPDAGPSAGAVGEGGAAAVASSEPPLPPPGTAPSESDIQRGAGYGTTLRS
jgi:Putative Actinobacterial Holin-X, holin superfamily III